MIIQLPKKPCALCRKNEVEVLCDFVVGYYWTTLKDDDGKRTCDLPMCFECREKGSGHDFCPYHFKMLDSLRNPDKELEKRTQQYLGKVIMEMEREKR